MTKGERSEEEEGTMLLAGLTLTLWLFICAVITILAAIEEIWSWLGL